MVSHVLRGKSPFGVMLATTPAKTMRVPVHPFFPPALFPQ
jgi:hypothetical protein